MSDTPITMFYHTMSLILLYVTTVIADVFQTYTMYILIVQDSWCFSDILIVQDSWCFTHIHSSTLNCGNTEKSPARMLFLTETLVSTVDTITTNYFT